MRRIALIGFIAYGSQTASSFCGSCKRTALPPGCGSARNRAADAQPADSALERDIGVQLFDRTKRSVRLTNAGRVFLGEVHAILAQLDAATDHAREAQTEAVGSCTSGASSFTLSTHLPRVVRTFRAMYPQITLKLSVMHSNELMKSSSVEKFRSRSGVRTCAPTPSNPRYGT